MPFRVVAIFETVCPKGVLFRLIRLLLKPASEAKGCVRSPTHMSYIYTLNANDSSHGWSNQQINEGSQDYLGHDLDRLTMCEIFIWLFEYTVQLFFLSNVIDIAIAGQRLLHLRID
jgi:hypothetical protein